MDRLRTPFFLIALILILLTVMVEIGMNLPGVVRSTSTSVTDFQNTQISDAFQGLSDEDKQAAEQLGKDDRPPGLGIPALAFLDGILLFTLALMGAALILPERLQGRAQGIVTLFFALSLLTGSLVFILSAIAQLMLMISLLLAFPFGTIVYLIVYGSFNRGGASVILALLLLLKFAASGGLFLAQQRFLQLKGLVLMILFSLLSNVIVSFLHGLVPIFLVSITDALAAIVVGIIALIWALVLLISACISIIKVLRVDRMLKA